MSELERLKLKVKTLIDERKDAYTPLEFKRYDTRIKQLLIEIDMLTEQIEELEKQGIVDWNNEL